MVEAPGSLSRLAWRFAAMALVSLGFAISGYLLLRHFVVVGGGNSDLFDICEAVFGGDCDTAIRSNLAVQLGIPLAGWGIVFYVILAATLLLAFRLGDTFQSEGTLIALALCIVATCVGAVLSVMMLSGAAAFCPLCVAVHAINLLLVPMVFLACGRTLGQLRGSIGQGFQYLGGANVVDPILVRWKVVGSISIALIGIVAYQWILIQSDRQAVEDDAPRTFEQVLAEFEAEEPHAIPLADDEPRRGNPNAKLQLVLFSDFQCPACQRFARIVAHVQEHHPELTVIYKNYPLGKACNAGVRVDLHPLSCGAAYAADAARRQNKFWEYHDALLETTEPLEPDALAKLAEQVGLDPSRFDADRADAATQAKVEADVALGRKLKIRGTPTAFLNGKLLSIDAMSMFDQLIEHETAKGGEDARN